MFFKDGARKRSQVKAILEEIYWNEGKAFMAKGEFG